MFQVLVQPEKDSTGQSWTKTSVLWPLIHWE